MKQYIISGVCLLSLLTAGCSNEDIIENENPEEVAGKTITLNATINNGADTRMTYTPDANGINLVWSTSEKFNLYQGTLSTAAEFTKNADGNAFIGTAPTGIGTYYAVYGNNITNTKGKLSLDISTQTGTTAENGIPTFMVAETEDLTQTLSFRHKLAVLKLNLEFPAGVIGTTSKVTLMGLHKQAIYTLSDGGSYAYDDYYIGTITATNGSDGFTIVNNKITAYIAVFPEKVAANAVTIKAETSKHDLYYYTIQSAKQLEAGKVVPVNVTLTKVEPEYVDLGLPSGTMWANMNVGAISPEDYGDYYAWGETETKSIYSWYTYLTSIGGTIMISSDCGTDKDPLKDYVSPNQNSIAGTEYDVVHVNWGGKWKMPTVEQFNELINSTYCSFKWTNDYNGTGVAGRIVTSKMPGYEGNSIFLPAAGCYLGSSLSDVGIFGYYWLASPGSNSACTSYFCITMGFYKYINARCDGHSVRPVSK